MADLQEAARLLQLIQLLKSRVARDPSQLAQELQVAKRTVLRYIAALRRVGLVCRFDRDEGRYHLSGDFFLPPTQLSLSEALSLSVLASDLAKNGQIPFLSDAWRAVTKIRSQLPPRLLQEVGSVERGIRVHPARVSLQPGCEEHFETLRQAIAESRKVWCEYLHPSRKDADPQDKGRFLFWPYSLYFGQRAWYVIGLSEKRGDVRTLKLNRVRRVKPTDLPFYIPDGWSVEKCFGKAWRMMPSGRVYLVKIHFDAEHASNVAETLWHPTQRIEWQSDGSLLFYCEVDGLDEILWWVLGHGSRAEVLAPQELRNGVQAVARDLSIRYHISTGGGEAAKATIEHGEADPQTDGARRSTGRNAGRRDRLPMGTHP